MANIHLSEEMESRIDALSKVRDRTPDYLMKTAIERFLDVEESLEAERQLVLKRWQEFEITGEAISAVVMDNWAEALIAKKQNRLPNGTCSLAKEIIR